MAKIYEIAFQLAGKLGSTFHSTFLGAQKQITNTDNQIKKLTANQGKITRFDGLKKELVETGYRFQAAQLKAKTLGNELTATEKPTKDLERAFSKARSEVEKLQSKLTSQHTELSKQQKEMTAVGLATVKTAEQTKRLADEINHLKAQKGTYENLQASADKFKASTISAFKGIAVVAGAATAAVSGYYATAMKLANVAMDQAAKARTGARLGFGIEAYQELGYAASKVGVDVENFDKSMSRFRMNMAKANLGTGPLANELKLMGYDVPKTMANLNKMKPEEQLMKMSEFMKSLPDDATRTRMAIELFGKEGMKMMTFMKLGKDGLQGFRNEAKDLGLVLSEDTVKQATEYGKAKKIFGQVWKGAEMTVGAALLPGLTGGMQELVELIKANKGDIQLFAKNFADGLRESIPAVLQVVRGVKNIATTVIDLAKGAAFAVGGFDNLLYIAGALFAGKMLWTIGQWGTSMFTMAKTAGTLFSSLKNVSIATRLWAAAQGMLNIAMTANPVGVVLVGIGLLVAAGYALYKNWDTVKKFMTGLWNSPAFALFAFMTGPVGLIIGAGVGIIANWESVKQWFTLLWNDPGAAFNQFIELIRGKFGQMVSWLGQKVESIKRIFTGIGSGSGATNGVPDGEREDTRATPHALGGFFSKPHLGLVAEKGVPEAIIPMENTPRSMGLLQKANQLMGFDRLNQGPQGFAALDLSVPTGSNKQSIIEVQHSPVYHIYGDKDVQNQVMQGGEQSNASLLQCLRELKDEEERVSFA